MKNKRIPHCLFFIIPFLLTFSVSIFILFSCRFPGNIDPDCINILKQVYGIDKYTNHHPIVYTLVLKFINNIGNLIFKSPTKALALFCVCQIIFIALCHGYSIYSLHKASVSPGVLLFLAIILSFWPVNINYSFTIGKDSIFAVFVLLMFVELAKIKSISSDNKSFYIKLAVWIVLICWFRSNSTFIILFMTITTVFLFRKNNKRLIYTFIIALFVATMSKSIVLKIFDISKPDAIESLAIPTQQIARVITKSNDLTQEEYSLLSEIVDVDAVPDTYCNYWVDFTKDLVRRKDNQIFYKEHRLDYLKLYISLGLRHPDEYIKAWYDETSAYYLPKESFGYWIDKVYENPWGYKTNILNSDINTFWEKYYNAINNSRIAHFLTFIATYTYANLLLLIYSCIKKDKLCILMGSYGAFMLGSLLISVPLNGEFRYIYSLALVLPTYCIVALKNKKEE